MSKSMVNKFLSVLQVIILLAVLSVTPACGVTPEAEISTQTQIHECGRIADRGERERCIEAAHVN